MNYAQGNEPRLLILLPARELAHQIGQAVEQLAKYTDIRKTVVYGGVGMQGQAASIAAGTDIIIATPGRLMAQLASGVIKLDDVEHLVLDEADRMLDMGFYEDIIRIIKYLPPNRQTLLFSATMPPKIRALANKILKTPAEVNIAISKPAEGILQQAYVVFDEQKEKLISHIFKTGQYSSVLIFASTKENVKKLDRALQKIGITAKAIHSDLEQTERENILREFKNKQLSILVGTDVLSRGIDVEGISLVINFDVPPDPEDYIHRIGRTARAATTGTAITFINSKDQRKFFRIESMIGKGIEKIQLPEALGAGPAYEPEKKVETKFQRPRSPKPGFRQKPGR